MGLKKIQESKLEGKERSSNFAIHLWGGRGDLHEVRTRRSLGRKFIETIAYRKRTAW